MSATLSTTAIMKTRVILFAVLVVAAGVGLLFLPVRPWFTHLEGYVQSLGAIGPAIVALAYIVCTVLFIPGSIITIGSGTLFGLKIGFLVVLIGANLGALCSFLLARTLMREKVARWAESNPKFCSLDQAIGRQGFKMVLLMRLSPIFPFVLLNYFLGLTAIRTGAYALANLLGMLPAMLLFVYIGAAARDAIAGQMATSVGFYQQIFKYVGLLATITVVVFVTRIARRALREAEQLQEGSFVALKPRLYPNHKPIAFDEMLIVGDPYDKQLIENCRPSEWANPIPAGNYNLVVIGAGTAGLVSAWQARRDWGPKWRWWSAISWVGTASTSAACRRKRLSGRRERSSTHGTVQSLECTRTQIAKLIFQPRCRGCDGCAPESASTIPRIVSANWEWMSTSATGALSGHR